MTNQITPATKSQLDGLIRLVLEAGYNEEAGLLQLASDGISEKVRNADELTAATESGFYNCGVCGEEKCKRPGICEDCLTPPTCNCFEVMGDNTDCPKHGRMFKDNSPVCKICGDTGTAGPTWTNPDGEPCVCVVEIKADYQERSDLYNMGMGA